VVANGGVIGISCVPLQAWSNERSLSHALVSETLDCRNSVSRRVAPLRYPPDATILEPDPDAI
jgi:hypothetical protein